MDLKQAADKVRSRLVEKPNGCMEWPGAKRTGGYGLMRLNGRMVGTHRIILAEKLNAPDMLEPCVMGGVSKKYALHSCDNPPCCNPDHLRLGSSQDNSDDVVARGRINHKANIPRKFSEDQIREIRSIATNWDGMCDMMKKHRVTQATIMDVVNRKTYKHVSG